MDQILEKWDEILMTVKTEHDISDIAFNTFLRPALVHLSHDTMLKFHFYSILFSLSVQCLSACAPNFHR